MRNDPIDWANTRLRTELLRIFFLQIFPEDANIPSPVGNNVELFQRETKVSRSVFLFPRRHQVFFPQCKAGVEKKGDEHSEIGDNRENYADADRWRLAGT